MEKIKLTSDDLKNRQTSLSLYLARIAVTYPTATVEHAINVICEEYNLRKPQAMSAYSDVVLLVDAEPDKVMYHLNYLMPGMPNSLSFPLEDALSAVVAVTELDA